MSESFDESARVLDGQLKALAIAAQQHPPKSPERQRALARLINTLQRSKKLVRPRRDQFQGQQDEIYAEALQQLFCHICDKIDSYHADRGEVLQWANFLLNRQFFPAAIREVAYQGIRTTGVRCLTLDDLTQMNPAMMQSSSTPLPSEQVRECLDEDPELVFHHAHIDRRPDANFRYLALRRLDGYSWQELSAELDISIATLSSFYQRCLTKFAPKFRVYLS